MPGNAIRVAPWRHRWSIMDTRAFRAAHADQGRAGLAQEIRWRLADAVRGRATDPYERAALAEWYAAVLPDEVAHWLAVAAADAWPDGD